MKPIKYPEWFKQELIKSFPSYWNKMIGEGLFKIPNSCKWSGFLDPIDWQKYTQHDMNDSKNIYSHNQ